MSLYIRNEAGEFVQIPSIKGHKGDAGTTPHIGDNGNWFIGDTDTGKPSRGENGVKSVNGISPDENGDVEVEAGGLSATVASLLITILRNGVYSTDQSANITALENALAGGDEPDVPDVPDVPDEPDEPDVPVVTKYTVTNELVNVVSSNIATSVAEGASYTATLVADDGYMLDSVTVIMDGVDVTADVYVNGVISIPAVTGDVEIVATARAAEIKAELITDGLMAYFDLRNLGDKANVTVGTTKGVMATQGNGALYSWTDQPITSSDNYGIKTPRPMMFSAEGNTTKTDLGTEFTVISFGYGECIGPGIKATNIDPRWQFRPSYNKADGTANVTGTEGSKLNGDNMKDYNYSVYRVSGANLTMINDTSRKDYNGNDYEGFVSWDSKPGMGKTDFGNGYGTAVAIYNRAISDVEIEEMRAFMKTLEVA